ncbi:TlpA family protein disulfide reductase [Cryptosporangium sp. NPDC048952]|uniref:TlpA family protein disulfide reductase n=1 Tax=Cryptosporangium sp. NPDC048952 TaxID=3363961 RepID=UPI00371526DD
MGTRVLILVAVLAAATAAGALWRTRTGRIRPTAAAAGAAGAGAAAAGAAGAGAAAAGAAGAGAAAAGAAGAGAAAAGAANSPNSAGAANSANGAAPAATPAPPPQAARAEHADTWQELGIDPGDAVVTLVQFSSAFCAPCRATRRILTDVSGQLPEVHHVEIDAESHLDAVRKLDVRSTPTTLLVDRTGAITGRAVGQPRRDDVLAAIGPYLSRDV